MSALKMIGNQAKNGMAMLGELNPAHARLFHVANCAWLGWRCHVLWDPRSQADRGVWLQSWGDGFCINEVVDTPINGCSMEFCLHSPIPHSEYKVI